MERKAVILERNKENNIQVFIDFKNAIEILPYINRDNVFNEYKDIIRILYEHLRNREKYCKVKVSDAAKDVFEMRFTNMGKNDRIYCKEYHLRSKRKIIMVELFEGKKSQKIPKNIKSRIETIGGYNYEFIE